jgi:nucleoid-associated protein YgaU
MKKNKTICLFLLIAITIGIQPVFGQQYDSGSADGIKSLDLGLASDDELIQALNQATDIELINKEDNLTAEAVPAQETSGELSDNEYLAESRRLAKLAEEAFSEGDYDASAKYADDAADLARQSDVYVSSMTELPLDGTETSGGPAPLPATYTVRPWSVSKDCFWNIAGFPWVYGNPRQWRLLYNANKSKLPNPNNPDILEPGIVLDIPSIKGEARQGAWESGKTYEPLK